MAPQLSTITLFILLSLTAMFQAANSPQKKTEPEKSATLPPSDSTTGPRPRFLFPPPANRFNMFASSFLFSTNRPSANTINPVTRQPEKSNLSLNNLVWGFSSGSDDYKEIGQESLTTNVFKDKESRDKIQAILRNNPTGNTKFSSVFKQDQMSSKFDEHFLI